VLQRVRAVGGIDDEVGGLPGRLAVGVHGDGDIALHGLERKVILGGQHPDHAL